MYCAPFYVSARTIRILLLENGFVNMFWRVSASINRRHGKTIMTMLSKTV